MIALRSVSLRGRAGAPILDGVSLEIAAGAVALVTGPSGCGKTALTRLCYAAGRPDEGQVQVFCRDLSRLRSSSITLLRRRLAVVTQEMQLIERDSALANAAVPLVAASVAPRVRRTRALAALTRFGAGAIAAVPVARLSSGERRRVCLARAAVSEPAVLIADDPTAHLDGDGRLAFLDLISDVRERGGAALVASSDPALAAAAIRLGWQVLDLGAPRGGEEARAGASEQGGNVVPFPQIERRKA
ncbi:MAG TPA: ATP-binding cassette domain-containing protein [Kofleriaceae bacterium]|jgi:ABC-type ATPase involved in cell division